MHPEEEKNDVVRQIAEFEAQRDCLSFIIEKLEDATYSGVQASDAATAIKFTKHLRDNCNDGISTLKEQQEKSK